MEKPNNQTLLSVLCRAAWYSAPVCVFVCSSVDGFGLEAEARMTTWHVMMPAENESDTTHSHDVSEGEADSCV